MLVITFKEKATLRDYKGNVPVEKLPGQYTFVKVNNKRAKNWWVIKGTTIGGHESTVRSLANKIEEVSKGKN